MVIIFKKLFFLLFQSIDLGLGYVIYFDKTMQYFFINRSVKLGLFRSRSSL